MNRLPRLALVSTLALLAGGCAASADVDDSSSDDASESSLTTSAAVARAKLFGYFFADGNFFTDAAPPATGSYKNTSGAELADVLANACAAGYQPKVDGVRYACAGHAPTRGKVEIEGFAWPHGGDLDRMTATAELKGFFSGLLMGEGSHAGQVDDQYPGVPKGHFATGESAADHVALVERALERLGFSTARLSAKDGAACTYDDCREVRIDRAEGCRFAPGQGYTFVDYHRVPGASGTNTPPAPCSSAANEEHVDEHGAAASTLDWFPGHYVLLLQPAPTSGARQRDERDRVLGGDFVTPFRGLQIKYDWASFETSQGDYSAGLAALKDDLDALARVPASRGGAKKLVIMLQYKQFDPGDHAVPAYMRAAGSTYCAGSVCGEYPMNNGVTAMIWQPAVRKRFQAWARAVGTYVAQNYPHQVAAVVLPETANSEGSVPFTSVGYTQDSYLAGLEAELASLTSAGSFPSTPVIQYVNFFPPNNHQPGTYLTELADFITTHPHAGLGCPDVGSVSGFHPPGYDVLGSATYQGVVPFNVAIETPDYETDRNASVAAAYARAVNKAAQGGFGASMVAWADLETRGSRAFDLLDVSDYIRTRPMPNTAPPTGK